MPLVHGYPDVVVSDSMQPWDYGLLAWKWPPEYSNNTLTTRLSTAGRLNVHGVTIQRPMTITNIHVMVTATPTALTSGQCGVALYRTDNTLVGSLVTGVHTAWGTLGFKTHALASGPFVLPKGRYDVALWYNGTTAPGLFRATGGTAEFNLDLARNNQGLANTSVTTAAPGTLGTITASGAIPHWVGLS